MYSYLVICLRSIQVIFFVCLLRSRLILIIQELKDIQCALNSMQSNELNLSYPLRRFSIIDRLLNMKRIYGELYESCEQISEAFGLSLLIISTQAFFEFTLNFYWGYMCLLDIGDLITYLLEPEAILVGILAFYCSSCVQYVSLSFNYHI